MSDQPHGLPTFGSILPVWCFVSLLLAGLGCRPGAPVEPLREAALSNGVQAAEALRRSHRFVEGWLAHADPESGLIPRNLQEGRTLWCPRDNGADNFPFMLMTAALTDTALLHRRLLPMLETERRLTSRLGPLPDIYSFEKDAFEFAAPDWERIVFESSEYAKDGLLPLTELLGPGPWQDRLIELVDGLWERAPLETPFGNLLTENIEVNGEMLQVLSRLYYLTGEERYLDFATRLGDYYLLGDHHPTRDLNRLRLRDHGCEVLSGLTELYAATADPRPVLHERYRAPIHTMVHRVLDVGRTPDGLFYNVIDPRAGTPIDSALADTWGYTLNGVYTLYLLDGEQRFRDAVRQALRVLPVRYGSVDWEHGSADGDADAIESALNLYNREPVPDAAAWIDAQIRIMWGKQADDGVVEGWHGDGNFARTSIMYALWKSQGVRAHPWREDLVLGAVRDGDRLVLALRSERPWTGKLIFDLPRHSAYLHLPMDWPRINQFPEWFVVESNRLYRVLDGTDGRETRLTGAALASGIPFGLDGGHERLLVVD